MAAVARKQANDINGTRDLVRKIQQLKNTLEQVEADKQAGKSFAIEHYTVPPPLPASSAASTKAKSNAAQSVKPTTATAAAAQTKKPVTSASSSSLSSLSAPQIAKQKAKTDVNLKTHSLTPTPTPTHPVPTHKSASGELKSRTPVQGKPQLQQRAEDMFDEHPALTSTVAATPSLVCEGGASAVEKAKTRAGPYFESLSQSCLRSVCPLPLHSTHAHAHTRIHMRMRKMKWHAASCLLDLFVANVFPVVDDLSVREDLEYDTLLDKLDKQIEQLSEVSEHIAGRERFTFIARTEWTGGEEDGG
jgi:hypothetical protein